MNKLKEFLKENQTFVFLGFLVIILFILYFFYIDKPLVRGIEEKRAELAQKKQESAQLQAEVIYLDELKRQYEESRSELAFVEEKLPREKEIPGLLRTITEIAQKCGVKFNTFIPKPLISHELYDEVPIEMEVSGTYHMLGRFLAALGKSERIITPSEFNITAYTAKEPKEIASVQSKLIIKTYIYKK